MIIQSLRAVLFFTLLTGLIYPLAMTGLAKSLFNHRSSGSLIVHEKTVIGSELIGQKFTQAKYFLGRPSASDFNANPSGASNLAPTSKDLQKQIGDRRAQLAKDLNVGPEAIPQDLLTTSASGLDPHISPEAAKIQIARVLQGRHMAATSANKIESLIDSLTQRAAFGMLGESRVNVLVLNRALDELTVGEK